MSLSSLYRTLVVNYVELDNIILSSRDSKTLVSALLLVTDSELLANVTEVESSSVVSYNPVVVVPPVLNAEVDRTSCRSVGDLNVLNINSCKWVSKTIGERELHLREEVAESEGYRRLRNSVLCVYRSSSIEEVLRTVNVKEVNDTSAVNASSLSVESPVSAVHWSESAEIVNVTLNPVLSVCVSPSVTTLSYILTLEYSTINRVHEAPYIKCSKGRGLGARISSNIGTSSILNECIREVDLRILWKIHDLGSVTSYSSGDSSNGDK